MNTIRNFSAYPDEDVKRVVRFAGREIDTARTMVHVEPMIGRGNWNGVAYPEAGCYSVPRKFQPIPPSTDYLVVVRLAPPETLMLPSTGRYRKRAEPYCLHTWQECLCYVAAHEFKHVEQFRYDLDISEVRCEAYANHTVKRFRLTDEGRERVTGYTPVVHYDECAMIQGNQGVAA